MRLVLGILKIQAISFMKAILCLERYTNENFSNIFTDSNFIL